jgi:hypothetical protein
MKQYCLKCRKFCVYFEGDYDYRNMPKPEEIVGGSVSGHCYLLCEANSQSQGGFYAVAQVRNEEGLGYKELKGRISITGKLVHEMFFSSIGYVTPMRVNQSFDTWEYEEAVPGYKKHFEDNKKKFFKLCDDYLRTTRCPLEPEDKHCCFYVERAMKKWNKM